MLDFEIASPFATLDFYLYHILPHVSGIQHLKNDDCKTHPRANPFRRAPTVVELPKTSVVHNR
jgi:hypothetical protein